MSFVRVLWLFDIVSLSTKSKFNFILVTKKFLGVCVFLCDQLNLLGKIRNDSQYNTFIEQTANSDNKMTVVETIRVKTLILMNILKERNIERIHTYVSDIEGADLTVLKTIEPFIKNKK